MIAALFDDHYEAFPVWREAGLTDLTCVHVDAHLDVATDGFTADGLAGIAQARTRIELDAFRGNPKLPWGGFHCGNYLYPALLDGTVTTLIWVVPRDLLDGASFLQSARQTLQGWLDLTLEEFRSLRPVGDRIEGTLFGRRLVLCTCDSLPGFSEPEAGKIALDIDVDYFIRLKNDRLWQTPHELYRALGDLKPVALTVATSCEGGYTPLADRYLGQVCLDVFSGRPQAWEQETLAFQRALRSGDEAADPVQESGPPLETSSSDPDVSSPESRRQAALETFLAQAPDFMKPSVLCALERFKEAEALDAGYRLSAFDQAGRLFQKRRYSEGLARLEAGTEESTDRSYMIAFLAAGNAQLDLSLEEITALLTRSGMTQREEARLLAMQGEVLGRQKQTKKAVEVLRRSLKMEPNLAGTHHQLAQHLRQLGDRDTAARHMRKALRLAQGKLSSLPILLDASRLYDELGQRALAKSTRRELQDKDVTGFYAINSILDSAR
jgi:tetratricopeptide (TPR) repeat protein